MMISSSHGVINRLVQKAYDLAHLKAFDGTGMIDPEVAARNPQEAQAALTRGQWAIFEREFKPREDQAIAHLMQAIEPRVEQAGLQVGRTYLNQAGMTDRMLSRYGMRATGDVRDSINRLQDLSRGLDITRVENETRDALEEQRLQGLAQMLGLMRGVSSSASQNLGAAASMANQRAIAGRQNEAAKDAARTNLLATAAGIAAFIAGL